jgi:hypothetical protein
MDNQSSLFCPAVNTKKIYNNIDNKYHVIKIFAFVNDSLENKLECLSMT